MTKSDDVVSKQMNQQGYLGHRERMRKRVLEQGSTSLTQQDIIEMLLMATAPRRDVKPQAKELLRRFKDVRGVLNASVDELQQIKGIKSSATGLLKIVDKICLSTLQVKKQSQRRLLSHKDIFAYTYFYTPKAQDSFLIVFLKANGVVIKKEICAFQIQDDLRALVREALEYQADQLIISLYLKEQSDQIKKGFLKAKHLYDLLSQLGIRLSDYILMDEETSYSLLRQKKIAIQDIQNFIASASIDFEKESDDF